jgi:hypothetical protein
MSARSTKRASIAVTAFVLATFAGPATVWAQSEGSGMLNWGAVFQSLGRALGSWRQATAPATPTAVTVPATATVRVATATRTRVPATATRTRIPTATRTVPPPTRTRTATRTATLTRTASHTPTATYTRSPRPTLTASHTPTSTRTRTSSSTPRPSATPTATIDPALFTPTPPLGIIAFGEAPGIPPAQKLASAVIVFPYIETSSTVDTRVELINMSEQDIELRCFYVRQSDCNEIGFYITLTAEQPLTWFASEGTRNSLTFTAVPPFDGVGELKCAVEPKRPELDFHNVLQGRSIVYDRISGETVAYGADGFVRLEPGGFSNVVDLDGFTYEECPERLHFQALATQGVSGELIVVPCTQDLLTQTPSETTVQLAIVNEFEQVFSAAFRFRCYSRQSLSRFGTLSRAVLGTDTAHVIVRGVSVPLLGIMIDRFDALGQRHTAVNEPFLEGGAPARIIFP